MKPLILCITLLATPVQADTFYFYFQDSGPQQIELDRNTQRPAIRYEIVEIHPTIHEHYQIDDYKFELRRYCSPDPCYDYRNRYQYWHQELEPGQ